MVLSDDMSSCRYSVVAPLPSDAVLAVLCVSTRVMRGCVSTPCLGCHTLSWCCLACVFPRGIHSLFAAAVLLCLARCLRMHLSSRCDWSASGVCGLSVASFGVTHTWRVIACSVLTGFHLFLFDRRYGMS